MRRHSDYISADDPHGTATIEQRTHVGSVNAALESENSQLGYGHKQHPRAKSGINKSCVLVLLDFFNIIRDIMPDFMHISKGIVKDHMIHLFKGLRTFQAPKIAAGRRAKPTEHDKNHAINKTVSVLCC